MEHHGKRRSPEISDDFGATRLATQLADLSGKEVDIDELKELIGLTDGNTISELRDITTIGVGGIGAVFSAHEPILNREIAIKILRPAYRTRMRSVAGFIREARITAQIDHPNVVPVHRLGVFDDAGVYFTMKRVEGINLSTVLRELKAGNSEFTGTYTRRRLLEIFIAICNGVAFAHSKGIIHRDLKPQNVMLGDYGEVFVVDWGLAIYRAEHDNSEAARRIEIGDLPDEHESGKVSGTPAFMAPELAIGGCGGANERTDVYSLGAILYCILTWEQSPLASGLSPQEQMAHTAEGRILRPRRRAPRRHIPFELEAVAVKAMNRNPEARYGSVSELLNEVRSYLDKRPVSAYSPSRWYRFYKLMRRHPTVPLVLLAASLMLGTWFTVETVHNRLVARSLMHTISETMNDVLAQGNQVLKHERTLRTHYAESGDSTPSGEVLYLRRQFLRTREEFNINCSNVWSRVNELLTLPHNTDELKTELSDLIRIQLRVALATANRQQLHIVLYQLQMLPNSLYLEVMGDQPDLVKLQQLLEKDQGELKLYCNLPLASCKAVPESPKEEDSHEIEFSESEPVALPIGKSMIRVAWQDRQGEMRTLTFPVMLNAGASETVSLELPDEWPENMACVPGGNFRFGNQLLDEQFAQASLSCFFISRTEVTFKEYLAFWKQLSTEEQRSRFMGYGESREHGRKIFPLWDSSGKLRAPYTEEMPVIGISAEAAEAYCNAISCNGTVYRLPTVLEWEKAARGVDGNEYVWGNSYQAHCACVAESGASAKNVPSAVASYPVDRSVYGCFDMSGNVRELVRNLDTELPYAVKGSGFASPPRFARAAETAYATDSLDIGFRCVAQPTVSIKVEETILPAANPGETK